MLFLKSMNIITRHTSIGSQEKFKVLSPRLSQQNWAGKVSCRLGLAQARWLTGESWFSKPLRLVAVTTELSQESQLMVGFGPDKMADRRKLTLPTSSDWWSKWWSERVKDWEDIRIVHLLVQKSDRLIIHQDDPSGGPDWRSIWVVPSMVHLVVPLVVHLVVPLVVHRWSLWWSLWRSTDQKTRQDQWRVPRMPTQDSPSMTANLFKPYTRNELLNTPEKNMKKILQSNY